MDLKEARAEGSIAMVKRKYIDNRGWKYQVMSGIGEDCFKARYQKPEKHGDAGWKGLTAVSWRSTAEAAQADLDQMAEKKGWKEWKG